MNKSTKQSNARLKLNLHCKQKTFRRFYREIQVKKTKLYRLRLPPRTSSPSWCISGTACLISCEISLFVMEANREGILLETYASLVSLARRNWR